MTVSYADIESLGLSGEPEVVTKDTYVAQPKRSFEPLQPNRGLTVKLVDGKFKQEGTDETVPIRFGSTRAGRLSVEMALQIQEGEFANRIIFHRLNNTPFRNGDREGMNMYLDFLLDTGVIADPAEVSSDGDYAIATDALFTSEKTFEIDIDLEWYCNPNSTEYAGCGNRMKYAAKVSELDENGKYAVRIPCNSPEHDDAPPPLLGKNIVTNVKS